MSRQMRFLPPCNVVDRSVFARTASLNPKAQIGAWDLELGICLPDPPSGYTGFARFFLYVGDRFRIRLDFLFHTIEFSERLLPVVSDLGALCGVRARREVSRQCIDATLQRVRERLAAVQIGACLRKAVFPIRF